MLSQQHAEMQEAASMQKPIVPSLLMKAQPPQTYGFQDHFSHQVATQYHPSGPQASSRGFMQSARSEGGPLSSQQQHAGSSRSNQPQFQFNKTLFEQEILVRLRATQREDFTLALGLKIQM